MFRFSIGLLTFLIYLVHFRKILELLIFIFRNIPLSVLLVSLLLWAIGLLDGDHPTMFTSGLLVSWIYLRFYQRHSNGTRGDMADNFTFAR